MNMKTILGGNGYIVKIWHLKAASYLQALHSIKSFGSTLTPLLVDMFTTHDFRSTAESTPDPYLELGNISLLNSTVENITQSQNEVEAVDVFWDLLYSYNFITICMGVSGTLFFLALIFTKRLDKNTKVVETEKAENSKNASEQNLRRKRKVFFGFTMILSLLSGGIEMTFGSYILTFSVTSLALDFETASLICTAYWFSLAIGRAISIITSKYIRPDVIISINLSIAFLALCIFTFLCRVHVYFVVISSILTGISFAPVLGSIIAYNQRVISISGRETSISIMAIYVGYITVPAVTSFMFKFSPTLFVYVLDVTLILLCLVFVFIKFLEKRFFGKTIEIVDNNDYVIVKNRNVDTVRSLEVLSSTLSLN